ncbi:hypothetical protein [Kitasatospora aureofaciens]|uniref:hypothetical protein n=1 Tax=Kitasatospora aureofaciens TaxID=1894 RepID=UPI001DFA7773|nr:hypothetical protein [Kitasatospora aureofaciens]HJD81703.1 hypothetical protein [Kitasatospora aureofaciens]
MSEPDKFEDDLLYALTRTGEGFRPDQTDQAGLVAGGYQRGRRRWRRRSTAAVVGGAAALALVGTGAVYLTGNGSPSGGTATVAAAPSASTASAAALTPASAGAGTPTTPTAAATVSGDEVLSTFKALLPKGGITGAGGRGTDDPQLKGTYVGAQLVFDDGAGKSLLMLGVQKHRPGQSQDRSCPELKPGQLDACSVTTLADGSKLYLSEGYEYPDHRATTKEWMASLTGPDGREINLSEWNSPQEKGAPDSRPSPPLTLDQLKAIVTDKSWDRIVAAVKPDGVDYAALSTGVSLQDRQAILTRLLPAGVSTTKVDGNEVVMNVELAQGGATGSLVVRMQKLTGQTGEAKDGSQGATTLPEGGQLKLYGPGTANPKGAPMAEVVRNGILVQVGEPPTGKPLLSLDQLKAIATSPEWKPEK